MIKQIDKNEWNRSYDYEALCETKLSVDDLSEKYDVVFEEYIEDGLGTLFAAFVEIDKQKYFLQGFGRRSDRHHGVVINMQGNNPSVEKSVHSIVHALEITKSDLAWVQEELTEPKWALVRQGDDGNEIEVERFYRQGIAENLMGIYTKRGHKQCYTVKKLA